MSAIEWVLFDLGGVLVEVDQPKIFSALSQGCGIPAAEVEARLKGAIHLWNPFIEREFSPAELTKLVNGLLGSQLSEGQVVESFNAELGSTISSTADLLPSLRRKAQVGCLSNTNSIHWDRLLSAYEFMGHFDRRFASQILGCAKPKGIIYEKVEQLLGVQPRSILFFDDRQDNVDSAARLGWNAKLYSGHAGLVSDLSKAGLIAAQ